MNRLLFLLLLAGPLVGQSQSTGLSETAEKPKKTILYRPGFAVMLHAGTAGMGADVVASVNRRINLRLGGNLFAYQGRIYSGKDTDDLQLGFDYKLNLTSFNALVDFYPFKRAGFRLTGGAYYNLNQITFVGKPTKDVLFNDVVFKIDDVGTLDGKATFNKVAPYLGLGWGHPFLRHRLKFMFDVGFFYMQSPKIAFTTTKMLEPSSDQGAVIEQNLKPLKFYPVVNIGLAYNLSGKK